MFLSFPFPLVTFCLNIKNNLFMCFFIRALLFFFYQDFVCVCVCCMLLLLLISFLLVFFVKGHHLSFRLGFLPEEGYWRHRRARGPRGARRVRLGTRRGRHGTRLGRRDRRRNHPGNHL